MGTDDKVSQFVEALVRVAEDWAHQPTDYDEDTEQQIADGMALLSLLKAHGIEAPDVPQRLKIVDPLWLDHLAHPLPYRRRKDGLAPVDGCKFCKDES